ncbi:hypothetical protein ACFL2P_01335 [Candidatus Moduliflexota bacterium]
MSVPIETWEYFDKHPAEVITLFLDDARLTARLEEIKEELAALRSVPSLSPEQELAALRKEVLEEIDKAERTAARAHVQNSVLAKILELRRTNERIANFRCTSATMFSDPEWGRHEVKQSGVDVYGGLRVLAQASFDIQAERIKAGEVEDVHVPAAKKTVKVTKLEKEAHSIKLELAGDRLSPSWRYSNGGHPTQDHLKSMMVEYRGSLANTRFSLPVRPRDRRATSNAWEKIQSPDHPDAASISMTDPADVEAFHELKKHFLGEA